MEFEHALPRLVTAYDDGLLVPFLGAGMSRPTMPTWAQLIDALERAAQLSPEPNAQAMAGTTPLDLIRRANQAVHKLKRRAPQAFSEVVRRVLYPPPNVVNPVAQATALARLWWPLVLSTNYDDVFTTAYGAAHPKERDRLAILGRSLQDCQTVLSSLDAPSGCLYWALQGYMGRPAHPQTDEAATLASELVVGHEEYRRVTHASPHFRRAFADVFRRRSLLFLGSGLGEPYFLELFSEILETYGANPLPHYALAQEGELDTSFLRSRFNIVVLEYARDPNHRAFPEWLELLAAAVDSPRARATRWAYALESPHNAGELLDAGDDFQVVRGKLPFPDSRECAGVSAGRRASGELRFGSAIEEFLGNARDAGRLGSGAHAAAVRQSKYVHVFPSGADPSKPSSVAAVIARGGTDRKDLRVIRPAVLEVLDWAASSGATRLRLQLLAAGRTAFFPARYSLIETLRAFVEWRRSQPKRIALSVHVTDAGVLSELTTKRLNLLEVLSSDDVRFWVEVADARLLERELVFLPETATIGEVAARFDVLEGDWEVTLRPPPNRKWRQETVRSLQTEFIGAVGVLPGSTLQFVRPSAGRSGA